MNGTNLNTHCSTFYVLSLMSAVFPCRRLRTKASHCGSLCPQPVGPRRDHLWPTEAPSTDSHVPATHICRQKFSRAGNEKGLNIGKSLLGYVISCSVVILQAVAARSLAHIDPKHRQASCWLLDSYMSLSTWITLEHLSTAISVTTQSLIYIVQISHDCYLLDYSLVIL